VVSIDVGIKNLGVCAYDFVQNKVVFWDNLSLVPGGRYVPSRNVEYVYNFVSRNQELFSSAGVILVERQMRVNMRIIEAILQTIFYDRCIIVSPRCVKAHYGLSAKNYQQNKAKAVEWVTEFIRSSECIDKVVADKFTLAKKKDDLADAFILIMYYLETYSNSNTDAQHAEQWPTDV
jgi:hypothetical protein